MDCTLGSNYARKLLYSLAQYRAYQIDALISQDCCTFAFLRSDNIVLDQHGLCPLWRSFLIQQGLGGIQSAALSIRADHLPHPIVLINAHFIHCGNRKENS